MLYRLSRHVHIYSCTGINERGHKFEKKQGGIWEGMGEEKEGRNDVITK